MSDFIVLKNVRLAFPNLKTAKSQQGDDGKPGIPKYSATFLIDPATPEGQAALKAVKDTAIASAKAKWPSNYAEILKMLKDQQRLCYREGPHYAKDGGVRNGWEGMVALGASRYEDRGRPGLFDGAVQPLGDDPRGVIYSGCYVNAKVNVYAWHSPKFGKRIMAELLSVMFAGKGDAFTGGGVPDATGFEGLATETAAETSAEGLL